MGALVDPVLERVAQEYAKVRNLRRAFALANVPVPWNAEAVYLRADNPLRRRVVELIGDQFDGAGITVTDVLNELRRVAMQRIDDLVDPVTGEDIPLHELSDDAAASVVAIDKETRWESTPDGGSVPVTTVKVRRADKMAALGILAKHFKIVGDGEGVDAIAAALSERLRAARRRAYDTSDVEDARVVDPAPRQVVDSRAGAPPVPDGATIGGTPTLAEVSDERLW